MQDVNERRFMRIMSSVDSLCKTVHQCDIQPGDRGPLRHIGAVIAEIAEVLDELKEIERGITN